MHFLSPSFAAQRLELVGRTAHVNAAVDALAARADAAFDGVELLPEGGHPLARWHPAPFRVGNHGYRSVGHYVAHQKALLFGDATAAAQLAAAVDEATIRKLGRGISRYEDAVWRREARRVGYEGNCAKFLQDGSLGDRLLATGDRLLVEASRNRLWGAGLPGAAARETPRAGWPGRNWLGYVLTLLREDLRLTHRTMPRTG